MDTKRLFIGSMSSELCESLSELENRLAKYGDIQSPVELHRKLDGTGFGYLEIALSEEQLAKLKREWKHVKFKGSTLVFDIAKPTYLERLEEDKKLEKAAQRKIEKQQKIADARMERIRRRNEVEEIIRGRLREIPRKDLKNFTLRAIIKGKLKFVKSHKTKLWGYDKHKKPKDLVYAYINGEWRDGNSHVIDRVQVKRAIASLFPVETEDKPETIEIEQSAEEEIDKNSKLLASMFGNYDFDKKLSIEEEAAKEDYGNSDYEDYGGAFSDDEVFETQPAEINTLEDYKKQNIDKFEPVIKPFDEESDDDMSVDEKSEDNVEASERPVEEDDKPVGSDIDDEFVPVFGQKTEQADEEEEFIPAFGSEPETEKSTNTTEVLRGLFKSAQTTQTQPAAPETFVPVVEAPVVRKKHALFFAHLESPFLQTQTVLNRLKQNSLENYESWFWENRGELNRHFRSLKREKRKVKGKASAY